MSGAGHSFTTMELWFILGALVLTVVVGLVLLPGIRKALSDPPEDAGPRNESQK